MAVLSLRPIVPADHPFLLAVYASTRADELAAVPWTDQQKHDFLGMQFSAQHQFYQLHFGDASFDVLLVDEVEAGRLYVARRPEEMRIIDIALLPAFRGQGLGTQLIARLQGEAAALARPLRIHVERFNPALRLYQRLGFRMIEEQAVYLLMEWRGSAAG